MRILDWLRHASTEAEGAAYEPVKEETYVNGELIPEGEIVTEGEGDEALPTLRKGDRGDTVKLLQEELVKQGYDVGKAGCDGIFGSKTKEAVKAFQKAHDLTVDGVVGWRTWSALGHAPDTPQEVYTKTPNYKQYDSRWASKMYSSHGDKTQTMKSSGCGPTAMANIVAVWWDSKITPYDLALKSLEWKTRTYDSGTSSTFFRKCNALYGGKYQTTTSLETARKCLSEGGLVVVCFGPGKSGKPGYKKWTKGGHYCTMVGYSGETYDIADPASASSSRAKGTKAEIENARKAFYMFWR